MGLWLGLRIYIPGGEKHMKTEKLYELLKWVRDTSYQE